METEIEFKKGHRVFDLRYGWGTVHRVLSDDAYPIMVQFDRGDYVSYTRSGHFDMIEKIPTLSFKEYTEKQLKNLEKEAFCKYSKQERNSIYKQILADFNECQESHNNSHLSFEIATYFLLKKLDVNDFPEIIKYKPKEVVEKKLIYQGYWFPEMSSKEAISIHLNIIQQAINETEIISETNKELNSFNDSLKSEIENAFRWYKHTDFNVNGFSPEDCANEYLKTVEVMPHYSLAQIRNKMTDFKNLIALVKKLSINFDNEWLLKEQINHCEEFIKELNEQK